MKYIPYLNYMTICPQNLKKPTSFLTVQIFLTTVGASHSFELLQCDVWLKVRRFGPSYLLMIMQSLGGNCPRTSVRSRSSLTGSHYFSSQIFGGRSDLLLWLWSLSSHVNGKKKKKKTFLLLCVFPSTEAGRIAGHVRPHSAHFQPYLVQMWPVFSRGLTNRLLMKFVILFFFSFLVILSKKQPESSRWASHLLPYFQTLSPPLPQTNSDRLTVTDHSAANRLHHHKWGGGGAGNSLQDLI